MYNNYANNGGQYHHSYFRPNNNNWYRNKVSLRNQISFSDSLNYHLQPHQAYNNSHIQIVQSPMHYGLNMAKANESQYPLYTNQNTPAKKLKKTSCFSKLYSTTHVSVMYFVIFILRYRLSPAVRYSIIAGAIFFVIVIFAVPLGLIPVYLSAANNGNKIIFKINLN